MRRRSPLTFSALCAVGLGLMFLTLGSVGLGQSARAEPARPVLLESVSQRLHPADPGRYTVTVSAPDGGRQVFRVQAAGPNVLAEITEPEALKGQRILRRGPYLWRLDPAKARAVQLSPRRPLLGAAVLGDITMTGWVADYTVAGTSSIDGQTVLHLKAASPQATADKLVLTIESASQSVIRVEVRSLLDDAVLKTMSLRYSAKRGDRPRLAEITIEQAGAITTLRYSYIHPGPVEPVTFVPEHALAQ